MGQLWNVTAVVCQFPLKVKLLQKIYLSLYPDTDTGKDTTSVTTIRGR